MENLNARQLDPILNGNKRANTFMSTFPGRLKLWPYIVREISLELAYAGEPILQTLLGDDLDVEEGALLWSVYMARGSAAYYTRRDVRHFILIKQTTNITQYRYIWGGFDSAKNHQRQRRKRQSLTAQREKSQTPKFV